MQIEHGKYYTTRDGRVVGPAVWRDDIALNSQYWVLDQLHYNESGTHGYLGNGCNIPENDLIATAYPETGTLAEIGTQVGDVVAYVKDKITHTVHEVKDCRYYISEIGDTSGYKFWWGSGHSGVWQIVTRASDKPIGPVQMVTKTEIVIGEYGRVVVTNNKGVWVRDCFTTTELTAAIATMTEIRDAMEAM